jgi:hypothetical protein
MNFNPINAELNPICHLLALLEHLKFMGPCILSIFQYISNKMQRYTVYLYPETAQRVSGGNSTHHQERIQLYLQYPTAGEQTQQKPCRTASDIGAKLGNHTVGRGSM